MRQFLPWADVRSPTSLYSLTESHIQQGVQEVPTDQLVDAKLILQALAEIKRRGIWPMLQDLEHTEPELASFIFEEVSLLHSRLFNAGVRPKEIQVLQRQVQKLVLVTLTATVAAHRQLWELPKPISPPADDRPLPISD